MNKHFASLHNPTREHLLAFLATVRWRVGDQGKSDVFERGIFQNYSQNARGSPEVVLGAVGVFMNERPRDLKYRVFGRLIDELEDNPGLGQDFNAEHLFGFDAELLKAFLHWVDRVGSPPVQHVAFRRCGVTAKASIVEVRERRIVCSGVCCFCIERRGWCLNRQKVLVQDYLSLAVIIGVFLS